MTEPAAESVLATGAVEFIYQFSFCFEFEYAKAEGAELVRKKTAAMFAGFVTRPEGQQHRSRLNGRSRPGSRV